MTGQSTLRAHVTAQPAFDAAVGVDPRVVREVDEWLRDLDEVPEPGVIAEILVDRECAAGEYEGCSSELEAAYSDYRAQAARYMGVQL